jgi:hypothetical protein
MRDLQAQYYLFIVVSFGDYRIYGTIPIFGEIKGELGRRPKPHDPFAIYIAILGTFLFLKPPRHSRSFGLWARIEVFLAFGKITSSIHRSVGILVIPSERSTKQEEELRCSRIS